MPNTTTRPLRPTSTSPVRGRRHLHAVPDLPAPDEPAHPGRFDGPGGAAISPATVGAAAVALLVLLAPQAAAMIALLAVVGVPAVGLHTRASRSSRTA